MRFNKSEFLDLLQRQDNFRKDNNYPDQYYIKCLFCDDRRAHLGVNLQLNAFHCFRCDESGNLTRLFNLLKSGAHLIPKRQILGKNNKKEKELNNNFVNKQFIELILSRIKEKFEFDEVSLRKFFERKEISNEYQDILVDYFKKKQFSVVSDFLFFKDIYGDYVQVRILDYPNKAPKYLTLVKDKTFLLEFNSLKNVVITESPFDIIAARLFSNFFLLPNPEKTSYYASLGKSRFRELLKNLKQFNGLTNVYLILDKDSYNELTFKILNYKMKFDYPFNVFFVYYVFDKNFNDLFDLLKYEKIYLKEKLKKIELQVNHNDFLAIELFSKIKKLMLN